MAYIPSECSISDYEQVVYNGETKNKLYISFGGNELIDADHFCEKLTIKSRLLKNGNNYFSLDNFVSKEATLILHKVEIGKIKGPVIIELGTYIDKVQDYVYVPFGVFNIQGTPTNDKDKTTITLRDNSVNFDFDYNAKNEIDRNGGSATLYQILQDICKQAKVNCTVPSTLTGIEDKTGLYDNSIKARTYVSYIAEHCGKIATIDRNGYLIFVDLIGDAINVSGSDISIDNAIERPIETIQIDGKSEQATRGGKNLLPINLIQAQTINGITLTSLDDGTILVNGTTTSSTAIGISYQQILKANVEYKFINFNIYSTSNANISIKDSQNNTINYIALNITNKVFTPNIDTQITKMRFYIDSNQTFENYILKVMLIKSGDSPSWEQYGVSPSPDYPSEVECIRGKNLYGNIAWKTQTYAYFQLPTLDEDYALSMKLKKGKTIPSGLCISFTQYGYYDKTQKYTGIISNGTQTAKFVNNKHATAGYLNYLSVYPASYKDKLEEYFDVQLEKGSLATNYLPYNTIQIKNVGHNIFNKNETERRNGASKTSLDTGVRATIKTAGQYRYFGIKLGGSELLGKTITFSRVMTPSGENKGQISLYFGNENSMTVKEIGGYRSSGINSTHIPNVFPDNTNYVFVLLYGNANGTGNVGDYVDYTNLMFTVADNINTYEPYQENSINIDLQGNELCSLPNNIKDELIVENGRAKIIKNARHISLAVKDMNNSEDYPGWRNVPFLGNDYPNQNLWFDLIISSFLYNIGVVAEHRIAINTKSGGSTLFLTKSVNKLTQSQWKEQYPNLVLDLCYKTPKSYEIDLGEVETLSTSNGINNVLLDANMQTNMNLQYYKPKQAYTIPLNIVQSYEDGEDFKLSQVTYESGELYWNKGDNKNDTLYINSANPYITNQKNIDNIYNIVNGLEINSLKLKKQRGNPLLDCYDFIEIQTDNSNGLVKSGLFKSGVMKSMSSNATTYKTLAQNELIYNGKILQTFDTTITKQAKTTNVSKNNEASLKKYVKSEIDGVKGELTTVVGKVDTIDVKTNNNYQEILNMFDEYTPQSDFLELENNVTRIQTDTYTKTEINQKLTNGSVTKVLTTAGTFDNNGLTIEKTNAKTKGNFNEKGMTIKDATGSTDTELLFAGYDDTLNETIVRTKNIKVEKYLTIGKNSRIEDYSNGTGVFHIGE